jgi:hypothetical protein
MRTAITITLIVVGGLLVVAPLVADYQMKANHQANTVLLLQRPDANRVHLVQHDIHSGLAAACVIVGAALVGTGVYLTIREARATPAATHPPAA